MNWMERWTLYRSHERTGDEFTGFSVWGVQKSLVHHSLPKFEYNVYNEKYLIKIKTALQVHCIAKENRNNFNMTTLIGLLAWAIEFRYITLAENIRGWTDLGLSTVSCSEATKLVAVIMRWCSSSEYLGAKDVPAYLPFEGKPLLKVILYRGTSLPWHRERLVSIQSRTAATSCMIWSVEVESMTPLNRFTSQLRFEA